MTPAPLTQRWPALRSAWRDSACGRVEALILSALAVGVLLGGAGFLLGIPVTPWPMALGLAGAALGAWAVSWRRLALFAAAVALLTLATALTFSYVGYDTLAYHFPMQRLLAEGWNPVADATMEDFQALLRADGGGALRPWHTLFLPRLAALCGASVGALTGFFVADAFLGYALFLALWRVAARFAREHWRCGAAMAALFAAALVLSPALPWLLVGLVDHLVYAGLLGAALAYLTWRRTRLPGDLLLAALCLGSAMLSKTTGLLWGGLACVLAVALDRRRVGLRRALLALACFGLVVGASPFLTSWAHHGSPFYPYFTLGGHPPVDITGDFDGNADALAMGYPTRILYAWVSPALAVRLCAWLSGDPGFSPLFTVYGGAAGWGAAFRVLLLLSAVALTLARPNAVTALCLFLFATANLAPLKYIGYARYFPQIWAIPFLAAFNLAYAPRPILARLRPLLRPAVACGVAALTLLGGARALAYQGRQWRLEHERQTRFAAMAARSSAWALSGAEPSYTLRKRMEAAGLTLTTDPAAPRFRSNHTFLMPIPEGDADPSPALDARFPVCTTPGDLLRFPYAEALRPPRPLCLATAKPDLP